MIINSIRYGNNKIRRAYYGKRLIFDYHTYDIRILENIASSVQGTLYVNNFPLIASYDICISDISNITVVTSNDINIDDNIIVIADVNLINYKPDIPYAVNESIISNQSVVLYISRKQLTVDELTSINAKLIINSNKSTPKLADVLISTDDNMFMSTLISQRVMPLMSGHIYSNNKLTINSDTAVPSLVDVSVRSSPDNIKLWAQPFLSNTNTNININNEVIVNSDAVVPGTIDINIVSNEDITLLSCPLMPETNTDIILSNETAINSDKASPISKKTDILSLNISELHAQPLMPNVHEKVGFGHKVFMIGGRFNEVKIDNDISTYAYSTLGVPDVNSSAVDIKARTSANAIMTKTYKALYANANVLSSGNAITTNKNNNNCLQINEYTKFDEFTNVDTMLWLYPIQTVHDLYIRQAYSTKQIDDILEVK